MRHGCIKKRRDNAAMHDSIISLQDRYGPEFGQNAAFIDRPKAKAERQWILMAA